MKLKLFSVPYVLTARAHATLFLMAMLAMMLPKVSQAQFLSQLERNLAEQSQISTSPLYNPQLAPLAAESRKFFAPNPPQPSQTQPTTPRKSNWEEIPEDMRLQGKGGLPQSETRPSTRRQNAPPQSQSPSPAVQPMSQTPSIDQELRDLQKEFFRTGIVSNEANATKLTRDMKDGLTRTQPCVDYNVCGNPNVTFAEQAAMARKGLVDIATGKGMDEQGRTNWEIHTTNALYNLISGAGNFGIGLADRFLKGRVAAGSQATQPPKLEYPPITPSDGPKTPPGGITGK